MKTTLQTIFIIFIFFGIMSCKNNEIYDIAGPELVWYSLTASNNLLIQFNEPVKKLEYFIQESMEYAQIFFPKPNVMIEEHNIRKIKSGIITVKATDTSEHSNEYQIKIPKINDNPTKLIIDSIRLKYSEKKPQTIRFRAVNRGETTGYKMLYFNQNQFIKVDFSTLQLRQNEKIEISFIPDSTEYSDITITKKNQIIAYNKCRLSQTCSAVLLIDNRDNILDYILFVDTKKNDITYYKTQSRSFKKIIKELEEILPAPVITDVCGNTMKYEIVKKSNIFCVEKNKN